MALDDLIKRRLGKKLEDNEAKNFAKNAAGKFSTGRFTATQTGAKKLAETRGFRRDIGDISKAMNKTSSTEEYIRSRKYKS